jgi:hypothetical protein
MILTEVIAGHVVAVARTGEESALRICDLALDALRKPNSPFIRLRTEQDRDSIIHPHSLRLCQPLIAQPVSRRMKLEKSPPRSILCLAAVRSLEERVRPSQ